jgi:hypothetical protein
MARGLKAFFTTNFIGGRRPPEKFGVIIMNEK